MNAADETKLIEEVFSSSIKNVFFNLTQFTEDKFRLSKKEINIIEKEFCILKNHFINSLFFSLKIAQRSFNEKNFSISRLSYFNKKMALYKNYLNKVFPPAAKIWVLDGLVIEKQIGGLKYLIGVKENQGAIIDVLNSASSLALGGENPWLLKMDRFEDFFGWKDNVCCAYHPGIRQAFILNEIKKFYPVKKNKNRVVVHMESSGSIVDSIAIESVCRYAEKKLSIIDGKILAVDGTWAGGYGVAREATGFGVDKVLLEKQKKTLWVNRCLPPPTKNFANKFIKILKEKIEKEKVAGVYLEPDIIGDLGIIKTDEDLLLEVKKIMQQYQLPIILDCVQQLGRTGSYWGENVDRIFNDYDLLVITTAKSASNGQAFGMVILPHEIASCAYPLSQITTNQMNGPLLRVLLVAEVLNNKKLQQWFFEKSKIIEKIAKEEGLFNNLLGKYLNRGIYLGNNEQVKLAQIALLIEDGILVGALPAALRYQPMLLEFSETNKLIAQIIFRKVKNILRGKISKKVVDIYNKMKNVNSGLARKNK